MLNSCGICISERAPDRECQGVYDKKDGEVMIRLLTRRQIIEEWNKQRDEYLDSLCCPVCRNILEEHPDRYICFNDNCKQEYILKSKVAK